MRILWILLAVVVLYGIGWLLAGEFYRVAVMKGWTHRKFFWLPFLLGLPGWLLVVALPDRGQAELRSFVGRDLPEL